MTRARRRITILQSFQLAETSNPYVAQLVEALRARPDVDVVTFAWRAALLGRVDVFHVHWAEALIERRTALSTAGRRILFLVLLIKLRLLRVPIVRTMHNVELPEGMGLVSEVLLRLTERWTTLWITINPITATPTGSATQMILHGHYEDWFAIPSESDPIPGRFAFFGRIRRYKNIPGLISAFTALPADFPASLTIAGMSSSAELTAELERASAADPRVAVSAQRVDDQELVAIARAAELVVLPYPEMHNSGSVLAALSLGRPVLVPVNPVNEALSQEVGPGWVVQYPGELTAENLRRALDVVRTSGRSARPDLTRRAWAEAAQEHEDAFRAAIALRRRRS